MGRAQEELLRLCRWYSQYKGVNNQIVVVETIVPTRSGKDRDCFTEVARRNGTHVGVFACVYSSISAVGVVAHFPAEILTWPASN